MIEYRIKLEGNPVCLRTGHEVKYGKAICKHKGTSRFDILDRIVKSLTQQFGEHRIWQNVENEFTVLTVV